MDGAAAARGAAAREGVVAREAAAARGATAARGAAVARGITTAREGADWVRAAVRVKVPTWQESQIERPACPWGSALS